MTPRLQGLAGEPARIVRVDRGFCAVATRQGVATAVIPQKVDWSPATGDWATVSGNPLTLAGIAPRSGVLRRRAPSGRREQILAANIDMVWIVLPLDRPIVPGRVERALVVAYDGGVTPRLVLSKADVAGALDTAYATLDRVCAWVPRNTVAAPLDDGMEQLHDQMTPGRAIALLGESGSGKSTLVNAIIGAQVRPTGDVRARDRKGRHTTTSRELLPVPGGGLLLDTPGIRELGVLDATDGLAQAFPDVESLLGACRYRNCSHAGEEGCAVAAAVDRGDLAGERWQRYQVLAAEAAAAHVSQGPLRPGRRS